MMTRNRTTAKRMQSSITPRDEKRDRGDRRCSRSARFRSYCVYILEPFDFRLFQDLGAACDQATR